MNNKLKICRWRSSLFILSVWLLAGCSQHTEIDDDMEQRNAIGFSCTASKGGTRVDSTTIDNMEYFRVFAVWHRKDVFLMSNQLVEKTNNGWEYSPTLYWPGQDELSFFAYTPAISKGMDSYEIDKPDRKCTIEYTVNTDADKQEDFMVATALDKTSGPVNLNFQHALSFVDIEACAANVSYSYRIKSIKLLNLKTQGILTGTSDNAAEPQTTWSWNSDNDTADKSYDMDVPYSPEIKELAPSYTQVGSTVAVLPQTTSGFGIEIDCEAIDNSKPPLVYSYLFTAILSDITFEMGKRYKLKVTLNKG